MTTTLVFIADTHTNHKMGLNSPSVELEEGDTWQACEIQKLLYGSYMQVVERVGKIKNTKIGIVAGDYVDVDDKQRSNQYISRDAAVITENASAVIDPLARLCKTMYFVRGTEAHVGKGGEAEELVARDFDNAVVCPDTKKKSWWYLPLIVEGVTLDIAHHPPFGGGGRPQNRHGKIDRLAVDTIQQYAERGEKLPNLVIRAHIHKHMDSYDEFPVRAITLFPFCLIGAYCRRLGINDETTVGAILIHCDRGRYEVEKIKFAPKGKTWVKA